MKLFWDYGVNINEDIISDTEKNIGFEIPKVLKEVILKNDGAMLKKDVDGSKDSAYFDVKNIGAVSLQLKRHRILENYTKSEFANHFNVYQDNLPNGFATFAHDAGDNLIILNLNQDGDESKVYYLLIEEAVSREELEDEGYGADEVEEQLKQSLIFVANSFDELMRNMK